MGDDPRDGADEAADTDTDTDTDTDDDSDDAAQTGGFPVTRTWGSRGRGSDWGGEDYARLIGTLRGFLDAVAGSKPEPETIRRVERSLRGWSHELADTPAAEREQVFAHRLDLVGRGQVMSPAFHAVEGDDNHVSGTVRFGRFYLGGNGAVHGGAIPLLFDEVLGRLANVGGRVPSRTAYLHVNFRSITPIETELQVEAHFVREEGRKRFIVGTLRNGDTLCADADALFVQLNPGQP